MNPEPKLLIIYRSYNFLRTYPFQTRAHTFIVLVADMFDLRNPKSNEWL